MRFAAPSPSRLIPDKSVQVGINAGVVKTIQVKPPQAPPDKIGINAGNVKTIRVNKSI